MCFYRCSWFQIRILAKHEAVNHTIQAPVYKLWMLNRHFYHRLVKNFYCDYSKPSKFNTTTLTWFRWTSTGKCRQWNALKNLTNHWANAQWLVLHCLCSWFCEITVMLMSINVPLNYCLEKMRLTDCSDITKNNKDPLSATDEPLKVKSFIYFIYNYLWQEAHSQCDFQRGPVLKICYK